MAMTLGILHLRPRPPSLAAPSATLPTSRLLCNSRSSTFLRPLLGRKMQMGSARLRLVGSHCAVHGAFELSSQEDENTRTLRFREEMDKFDRKYGDGTALRALGAHSRQDAMLHELEATLFRDEEDKFSTYMKDRLAEPIIAHDEAGQLADALGLRAAVAIRMSARITANAHLRVGASEMSADTVKKIIRTYVSTFIKAAEDASNGKFDRTVIISFLDALGGLAAISHKLFEDTLAVVNNIEDSSSYYVPGHDVEALNHELQRNIKEWVTSLTTSSKRNPYQLFSHALSSVTFEVSNFVTLITNLRKKALTHFVRAHAATVKIEETNNRKDGASVVKDPEF